MGAANLVFVLVGKERDDAGCCANYCHFLQHGIPFAFGGKRSQERQKLIASCDTSSAGKFKLSRIKMAEMIEKTAAGIWIFILLFMFGGIMYGFNAEISYKNEAGRLSGISVCFILVFLPINLLFRNFTRFLKFQLRDVVSPRTSKVVAGLSVTSSTNTTENEAGSSGSTPTTLAAPLSPAAGSTRKMSTGA